VFINLKISDIKDKYVSESEKRIKEVFGLARSYEKAIIFFDEIDALAGERSESKIGHERSFVNELLSQMDGLESKGSEKRYLVLAATNMPWDVDIALRRAGRFDTTIFIPHPDFEKVLAKRTTVLSSWYSKAVKEVASTEEAEMFGELVEAGKRYLER